ncbi:hypothetical protein M3J09_000942 [Ascochyta lentis]
MAGVDGGREHERAGPEPREAKGPTVIHRLPQDSTAGSSVLVAYRRSRISPKPDSQHHIRSLDPRCLGVSRLQSPLNPARLLLRPVLGKQPKRFVLDAPTQQKERNLDSTGKG